MSILTQGTEIYVLAPTEADPDVFEVLKVECPTNYSQGSSSTDQIDVTCLDEIKDRMFVRGLTTPAESTLTINADPKNASHVRLYNIFKNDDQQNLKFAIGWSDGVGIPPTVDVAGDDFNLPTGRTWFVFEGYIADFPFSFETNSVVTSEITIQRSGAGTWVPKV